MTSSEPYILIPKLLVVELDIAIDEGADPVYKEQPLAQDWARVCKRDEEHGEAIAELILATGQNPRKGRHPESARKLLEELVDRAMTGFYAVQHFTKDIDVTSEVITTVLDRHYGRIPR